MQQDSGKTKRYRVYEGVGSPPPATRGPSSRWSDLPLDAIEVGDLIELPLDKEEVDSAIKSIRSYVQRLSKRNKKKYSVRKTEYGIGIWRVGKELPSNHAYQLWKRRTKR